MPIRSISHFLSERDVNYRAYNHPPTYTAQETAHTLHTTGYEIAKSVLLVADARYVLAVLPACQQVDLARFAQATGARSVRLATEAEMADVAPLCDPGSLPPIGNIFGLPVVVSPSLTDDEVISFSAGTHTEDIRLSYADFERLVQPQILDFVKRITVN